MRGDCPYNALLADVPSEKVEPVPDDVRRRLAASVISFVMTPRIRAEQIPAIAFLIKKHRHLAITLYARLRDKADPGM
jgi:hypothetical protein